MSGSLKLGFPLCSCAGGGEHLRWLLPNSQDLAEFIIFFPFIVRVTVESHCVLFKYLKILIFPLKLSGMRYTAYEDVSTSFKGIRAHANSLKICFDKNSQKIADPVLGRCQENAGLFSSVIFVYMFL